MKTLLEELIEVIENASNKTDWISVISAICSAFSLIAIVVLLIERKEKKRPYLQSSFELIKSNIVCITIRNVGEAPAVLSSIHLSKDFVNQLNDRGKKCN